MYRERMRERYTVAGLDEGVGRGAEGQRRAVLGPEFVITMLYNMRPGICYIGYNDALYPQRHINGVVSNNTNIILLVLEG